MFETSLGRFGALFFGMLGRKPTKSEQYRFALIQERGCVPCFIENQLRGRAYIPEPCDIHHTDGGDNHMATYGNCPWHHRGVPKNDMRPSAMREVFGPSLAINPRGYRIRYGSEADLLALQTALLLKSVEALQEVQQNGTRQGQDNQAHRFS